jgi:hypothetical protein
MKKTAKYNQELPKNVETALDSYIERIKAINWFKPAGLERKTVDQKIKLTLEAFGVKASIEYRILKTPEDWDAARGAARDAARDAAWDAARGAAWDAARDAAWDAAWGAARGAARDAAWDAARDAARDAAWDAARDAAWGAADLLASLTPNGEYAKKFPKGNFLQLVDIWEMGLYPVGVVDGKFICYVPDVEGLKGFFASDGQTDDQPAECVHKHIVLDGKEYDLVPHRNDA